VSPASLIAGGVVAAQTPLPSADAVLCELHAGNAHHAAKRCQHPHQNAARQRELVADQSMLRRWPFERWVRENSDTS